MELVYLSVGSNVDREHNLCSAINALRQRYGELQLSPVYESDAEGFEGAAFYNLVVSFFAQDVAATRADLKQIEVAHKRELDGPKFSDRTLDLDILLFGDQVLYAQDIDIPRREITRYAFVLRPLADLAPDRLHPVSGRRYADLWSEFSVQNPAAAEKLRRVAFTWEIQ